jgi:hypothetical protein
MSTVHPSRRAVTSAATPTWLPVGFGALVALAACGPSERIDEQLRADLLAASQAPSYRQQVISPAELGYPPGSYPNMPYVPSQGYGTPVYAPPAYPSGYPVAAPAPRPRVVYAPQPAPRPRASTASAGTARGSQNGEWGEGAIEERNTQKGAMIGAATGAAIGIATARDRVRGAAIGALGGAVLGGVIGHQIKTPPQ